MRDDRLVKQVCFGKTDRKKEEHLTEDGQMTW